jgi:hypothetical protein
LEILGDRTETDEDSVDNRRKKRQTRPLEIVVRLGGKQRQMEIERLGDRRKMGIVERLGDK